ncbi:bifunctional [glutamine synthetase] adenylyltransferase/[glutamine synthetase]-adenylyl-L-tyrosine phosphorylase [Sphingomonas hankyongi]|uniref:Bifunctional [glutamine synthetase] adenylyltransferase/[glutamine synthetase]-adenylyl-L-tyrosine phosphorylase n=1 Tax=Sphingomonas hankyongi TaxID=2908209 RepID=A0ABT0RZS4_9SPHN|nr:bifunctional [glutamine synthetase] adenylyltransferase/[glutamine synthetase]-adenylyl-L-tyrosine phosphorylase [Sphingomonas hankyongi]MCL6728908.1 bifunctional [glutamine synthetase] adenylyltransferase/[glutamine synthetase]-adenylyl-L-tyrosine phosphorylase [Sphingomonas hankyongi]
MRSDGNTKTRESAVIRAKAHSPFLREAIEQLPDVAETFLGIGTSAAIDVALSKVAPEVEVELRRRRYALALAVALGDLSGEIELEQVTTLLSDFADSAIDRALAQAIEERVPGAGAAGFAVIAMGKLGSGELNYSSDVDLLFLFDPAMLAKRDRDDAGESAVRIGRRVIELLQRRTSDGYVARVDLRLRPSPEVTPIVLPVDAAISHYESSAAPWERAAFIRARACAADKKLGERFLEAIRPFVWRRSLDFGVIEDVRQISARIRDHFAQGAKIGPGYDLKRGRGGIREIEFFVQIQQMIHGGRDMSVRNRATLDALAALVETGRMDEKSASVLSEAYRLLRTIEHRVQMVEDAQTHMLPAVPEALENVAHLHGLDSGSALLRLLEPHVEAAGSLFDSLSPEGDDRLSNDPNLLASELKGLGFTEPELATRHVAAWRSGKARSLRSPAAQQAFEAMLPGLLQAIASGADPAHALNRLSDIVERLSSGINLFRLLGARPNLARLLAKILAHAPTLADQLARRPELLEGLFDASSFEMPPPAEELADQLTAAMHGHPYDVALDRVRRLVNERRFALGVQLIDRHRDPLEVAFGYARVAEGAVRALASAACREFEESHGSFAAGELLILGLGRLGGCALTHASDLDIIYLHTAPEGSVSDGAKPLGPNDYFNRLASRVTAALSVPTAAGPLYDVDIRLRPEGAKGMLVVSLEAFERYQRDEAWTWEHMALCRARPVFGSHEGRAQVQGVIDAILRRPRDIAQVSRDAAKMRTDMEHHKPAKSALDVKLGPGGLVDLEFAVHVLQLTRHVGLDPRLDVALSELEADSLLNSNIVDAQKLLTRMLVLMRLVAPDDVKPTAETWQLVAEACGAGSWDALLAGHDAARQSVAELWDSIKREGEQ